MAKRRLTRLENDVAQVREEWAVVQQAPLIQARLLNALRETQLEHSRTLEQHGRTLDEHTLILEQHGRTLDQHTQTLERHSDALAKLGQGQEQIVGMLTTLIDRTPEQN